MTSPYSTGILETFGLSGDPKVDPLVWWGLKWGNGGLGNPVTISYSFPTYNAAWIGDYWSQEPFQSFQPFTAAQQTAAKQSLALWAEVANITFVQVSETSTNVGDIRFGNSGAVTNSGAAAWAYLAYQDGINQYPESGDIWFDVKYPPNLSLAPGQFGFAAMLHEIGHAIGLDHPFYDGNAGEVVLDPQWDTDQYTVMSYTAELSTLAYASTPQLLDILAIQYIYGANMSTRTGNDTYKFSASVEVNKTIWDAGGIDTIDLSNQTTNSLINLTEGTYSRFCAHATTGTASLLGIAYGVTIENAFGGAGNDQINGNAVANRLTGGSGRDTIWGFQGDDTLEGGLGNDTLHGATGHDRLDGGAGTDVMKGGAGNDVYVIDSLLDVVDEEGNADTSDRVRSSVTVNLAVLGGGAIEHAELFGTAAINATGNAANNTLTGNVAANKLDGGAGADTMIGGNGADTYVVDNIGDQVVETTAGSAGGLDLVLSSMHYTLGANVEKLTLTGAANLNGTGNNLNNTLTGNDGHNRLNGEAGNDTMIGGKGNDTYVVNSIGDVVQETVLNIAGGGTDTVESSITFTLATRTNIENLTLTGSANINGTGNALANVIRGNSGKNVLDGGIGADTLRGGAGNDIYLIDHLGDLVDEEGNTDSADEVRTKARIAAGFAGIENYTYLGTQSWSFTANELGNKVSGGAYNDTLNGAAGNDTLIGNGGNDLLIGGIGDDWLDGGLGNDRMKGGAGNDTYIINAVGDAIDEEGNSDSGDVVRSTISVNLAVLGGGAIEQAILLGTGAINATGNASNNVLTGNVGANRLDGGAGADTMIGGNGADTYVVDNIGDVVMETIGGAAGGVDLVLSSVNYTLGANIEKLTLTGTASINGTGNGLNNTLLGNDGANRLDGGAGNDTMTGGKGNDTYVVNAIGDLVNETILNSSGGGIDTIESSFTFSLATFANVENLTLTGGGAINGTGNALNNQITGNSGNNTLDGGLGADVLKGGGGNDIYLLDNLADVVVEESAAGNADEIKTKVLIAAAFAGVENYTYTGTSAWTFTGNELGNKITGGSANDSPSGGEGNDLLLGNGGNDTLAGNAGDDTLDGGTGNDKMKGGAGNDTYTIDSAGDVIDEEGNTDTGDLVRSTTSVNLATLAAGLIEHATLLGLNATNATGNGANNVLTGNDAANILNGAGGADTLVGGKGSDTYIVDNSGDKVIETVAGADGGVDLVRSSVSFTLGANVENLTLIGTGNINATGNSLNNILNGNDGANILNGDGGNDTMTGGKGDDTYIVNSIGDIVNETVSNVSGGGVDTIESTVTFTLAEYANIENLHLIGTGNINGTGNDLDNEITGNDGQNVLSGGIGSDVLDGGPGNDLLSGGESLWIGDVLQGDFHLVVDGKNTLTGGAGSDTFTLSVYNIVGQDDTVTDFTVGGGGDILDIKFEVFSPAEIPIFGPIDEGYVAFVQSGSNTQVWIDTDGGMDNAVLSATLLNASLTAADTANYTVEFVNFIS